MVAVNAVYGKSVPVFRVSLEDFGGIDRVVSEIAALHDKIHVCIFAALQGFLKIGYRKVMFGLVVMKVGEQ